MEIVSFYFSYELFSSNFDLLVLTPGFVFAFFYYGVFLPSNIYVVSMKFGGYEIYKRPFTLL